VSRLMIGPPPLYSGGLDSFHFGTKAGGARMPPWTNAVPPRPWNWCACTSRLVLPQFGVDHLEVGAAVNGVIGGVKGAVDGVQSGLSSGSRSVPAAALTVAAVGAAGLVEWPVLLPVAATVLGVHYLTQRSGGEHKRSSNRRAGSRAAAKGRSGTRASKPRTAARSRPARSARR
jgi:hypothetical protein